MKTTIITIVALLVGVVGGIFAYPFAQNRGWVVNKIAKNNYDAYYKLDEYYKNRERDLNKYFLSAGVEALGQITPRDITKLDSATTSQIVFSKGCDLKKTQPKPDEKSLIGLGNTYQITCK